MIQQWPRNGQSTLSDGKAPDGNFDMEVQLHARLIRDIDESVLRGLDAERARQQVERAARSLASEMFPHLVGDTKEEIISHIADEVLGHGPIEPLLRDPSIS